MDRLLFILSFACAMAGSADLSAQLLSASSAGKTDEVRALLEKGADIETSDKNGRTPLMLAVQHGHPDTVRLLLSKGAHASARDKLGWSAYGLVILAPAGHGDHAEALKALPPRPRIRLAISSEWLPARLQSSCFLQKPELAPSVAGLKLNAVMREELLAYANTSGKGLVEIVEDAPDAIASLTVIPGVACEASAGDNLTLAIDVRLFRTPDRELLFEKSFGGGFKGLRTQTAHNVAQYAPIFLDWIRPQAGPVYWALVEKLL